MKNNSIFIVIILLISFLSCQKKEKRKAEFSQYQEEKDYSSREGLKSYDAVLDEDAITKIEMSRYGGRPGINVTLTITADSVRYYYKQNSTDGNISKNKVNTYTDWNEITHSFLLEDFAKLKSGKSRQPADGVDVKFTVVAKSKTYNVVNFQSDPSHHKINEFVNLLNEYEKKMIVQGK